MPLPTDNRIERAETLRRLGIEQLPHLIAHGEVVACAVEAPSECEPISIMTVPARKCPNCLSKGQTVWVIPGKCCSQCGTPVS